MDYAGVIMLREQAFLQTYFSTLAQFNFDKAKELADKERDGSRTGIGSNWHLLLGALSNLALAEKNYMSFGFYTTKSFLRNNSSQKIIYDYVKTELSKLQVQTSTTSSLKESLEELIVELNGQLIQLVQVRLDLIDLYVKLFNFGQTRSGSCEEFLQQVTAHLQYGKQHFQHKLLNDFKTGFSYECEILSELLSAELELEWWSFLPALFHLYTVHDKLNTWTKLIQPRESRRISFSPVGFLKQHQMPLLHQWLVKLKGCILAKFTIYFHEILSKQTSHQEMKNLSSKVSSDLYQKIISFQKKADAVSVCFTYDAKRCPEHQTRGYHLPMYHLESPQNGNSFPVLFSYPPGKPESLWPSIVKYLDNQTESSPEKLNHYYMAENQHSLCMIKVDFRVAMIIIFAGKRSEKDSYISTFTNEVNNSLRFNKMLSSIRPG
ncbi:hypothetical protein CHUAL_014087 [Chamberlinius hualienensis]